MPSHRIHARHALLFLENRNVKPDPRVISTIDSLIDAPQEEASELVSRAWGDPGIRSCLEEELGDTTILWLLHALPHDMRTQRYSPRGISWSRMMISVLRRFVSCLYGRDYGLLVDLHVLLDMAQKLCCEKGLLREWAEDVGIDEAVLKYYEANEATIYSELGCGERRRAGRCGFTEVFKLVRGGGT